MSQNGVITLETAITTVQLTTSTTARLAHTMSPMMMVSMSRLNTNQDGDIIAATLITMVHSLTSTMARLPHTTSTRMMVLMFRPMKK